MVTGTSVKGSKEALRLTRIYPGTLYSTGGKYLIQLINSTNTVYRQTFMRQM